MIRERKPLGSFLGVFVVLESRIFPSKSFIQNLSTKKAEIFQFYTSYSTRVFSQFTEFQISWFQTPAETLCSSSRSGPDVATTLLIPLSKMLKCNHIQTGKNHITFDTWRNFHLYFIPHFSPHVFLVYGLTSKISTSLSTQTLVIFPWYLTSSGSSG